MVRELGWMALVFIAAPVSAEVPYVNFENHPVRALALSPNRQLLAVTHTSDARVQLIDVSGDAPLPVGNVMVGTDPVAVQWRNDGELWVVNHLSDSISIVDVPSRRVTRTLATGDEPFDVVFAGNKAFVSCSQVNQVQVFDVNALQLAPQVVAINGEDPRALAVSRDGSTVYAAIFESGNASTVLAGSFTSINPGIPNAVSDPRGPYGGRNPPPNRGTTFDPPLNAAATPPRVSLIVKRDAQGRWMDDNNGDWTAFVSGPQAAASGRRVGWTLGDRDIAAIRVSDLQVSYTTGLMNIGMALAVNPGNGEVTLVGTDARNEVRFEPNINGKFITVNLARVAASGKVVSDLNPHLAGQPATAAPSLRERSLGDPRAIAWNADGSRGYIAGMGSNNVVVIDANGARIGQPIRVGEGPVGLALDGARSRLYVWNHFDASLSQIDTATQSERTRLALFNPLPAAIREGRALLYDTQRTSGGGQVSCASCHIDARMDRLAWDLGDPSKPPQRFDQNCITQIGQPRCEDFHSMKGPMTTQTMQDIIGHEPHHWRGDRTGIEAFNPAFKELLGDDVELTAAEMQDFEDFLSTIHFPPNPFRNFDNSLPTALPLVGHYASGRFAMAGTQLPVGNAVRGTELFTTGLLDNVFQCGSCHTLPTGMATNGPLLLGVLGFPIGGRVMPIGPNGENHLGVVSTDGSTNVSIKVPQMRNQHEKVGFELSQLDNNAGFGFFHDGAVDSLAKFFSASVFSVRSDQDVADLIAMNLAFAGSEFPRPNAPLGAPAPLSKDAHAGVGQQVHVGASVPARAAEMLVQARAGRLDLIVRGDRGYVFDRSSDSFIPDDGGSSVSAPALQSQAAASAQTWTVVPRGLGRRLGIDRDGDNVLDGVEIRQGSNPADAASTSLRALAGLWFNPVRSGHGLDIQHAGSNMVATWYTYNDDGSPTWYLSVGPRANPYVATLKRYTWNGTAAVEQNAGELRLTFTSATQGSMRWTLGARTGTEPIQSLLIGSGFANPDRTGTWYAPTEPGWGLSIHSDASVRASVLYFYDGAGQPRWSLGVGVNSASETLAMQNYRGFCPDCAATPTTTSAAGQIAFAYSGARAGQANIDIASAATPNARWQRNATIAPLTEFALRPEQY